MKKQTVALLNAYYKNATVGSDAVSYILPKVQDPQLEQDLHRQLNYYQSQEAAITQQLNSLYEVPTAPAPMVKLCTNWTVALRTVRNQSSKQIATLLAKGTYQGILQTVSAMNGFPEMPDQLRQQGEQILRQEEHYINRLKPYL